MESVCNLVKQFLNMKNSECALCQYFYYGLIVVGVIKVLIFMMGVWRFINRHFLRKGHDLLQRYGGPGTWALVTGASDGFGAEFSRQLALKGFNIVLVSRTMSKLQAVEKELKTLNPKINVRIVQADFSGNTEVSFYQEKVLKQVQDIDIGLVINNAGVMMNGRFDDLNPKYLTDTLDVNVTQVVNMTSLFLPKLLARKARSGLVNVSSMIAYFEGMAGDAIYCASKAHVNIFTHSIAKELEGKNIDVYSFTPGMASTNLWQDQSKRNPLGITAKSVVTAGLRDLGYETESSGHWNHDLQTPFVGIMSQIPGIQYVFNYVYGSVIRSA